MWILLLLGAGLGGLLLWKSAQAATTPAAPALPAVFKTLTAQNQYLLNVFTTNPPPPAQPPDLSVSIITFLASQLPLQGIGKIAQVAQGQVDPSALPPDVPRPSPGTLMTQWGVPVMATSDVTLPRVLTMPDGTVVTVMNGFLIQGLATPATTAKAAPLAKPAQAASGFHMNEPGFMSDQTDIKPIWRRPQG